MKSFESNLPLEGPFNESRLIGRVVYLIEGYYNDGLSIFTKGYIRNIDKSERQAKVKFSNSEKLIPFKYLRLLPTTISEFKEETEIFQEIVDDLKDRLAYMEEKDITIFIENDFVTNKILSLLKSAKSDEELIEVIKKRVLLTT